MAAAGCCAASTLCDGEAEAEPDEPSGSARREGGRDCGSSWPSSFRLISCTAMLNSCLLSFPFAS